VPLTSSGDRLLRPASRCDGQFVVRWICSLVAYTYLKYNELTGKKRLFPGEKRPDQDKIVLSRGVETVLRKCGHVMTYLVT
jgi:hypothetical protein